MDVEAAKRTSVMVNSGWKRSATVVPERQSHLPHLYFAKERWLQVKITLRIVAGLV